MSDTMRKPWGGRKATKLSKLTLTRDYDPGLGYAPCHWCGKPATTADHYPIARSDGGPDTLANLVAACTSCNCSHGALLLIARHRTPAPPSRQW